MGRLASRRKRFCNWVAPHCSSAGCQLMGTSPCVPATGRASQLRYGKYFAEQAAFVGDHQHVIGRRVLRQRGDLLLDLFVPAIRASGPDFIFKRARLDVFAPNRFAARRSAAAKASSSGPVPYTRNQRRHCFQTRYCASASASIDRDGVVCTTFGRQSCSPQPVVTPAGIEN